MRNLTAISQTVDEIRDFSVFEMASCCHLACWTCQISYYIERCCNFQIVMTADLRLGLNLLKI